MQNTPFYGCSGGQIFGQAAVFRVDFEMNMRITRVDVLSQELAAGDFKTEIEIV
jgi:hypothetical protein